MIHPEEGNESKKTDTNTDNQAAPPTQQSDIQTTEKQTEPLSLQDIPDIEELTSEEKKQAPSHHHLEGFASIEHKIAGDKAFQTFWDGLKKNNPDITRLLTDRFLDKLYLNLHLHAAPEKSPDGIPLTLSPGDWVALGGDFYGNPEAPISIKIKDGDGKLIFEPRDLAAAKDAFRAAYSTLAEFPELKGEARLNAENKLSRIKKCINDEEQIVAKARSKGKSVSQALVKHSSKGNQNFSVAFVTSPLGQFFVQHFPLTYLVTEYVNLAQYNFDHFGEQAKLAYEAGHQVAMETAVDAANTTDDEEKARLLVKAFTQELFACHFLTDLFSAGHMRTPRLELINYVYELNRLYKLFDDHIYAGALASLLAMAMHDEDNARSLLVSSGQHPDREWKAFGDHCYFDITEATNNLYMQEAIGGGLGALVRAYINRRPERISQELELDLNDTTSFNFKKYLPKLVPTANNHHALFLPKTSAKDGKVSTTIWRRRQINLSDDVVAANTPSNTPNTGNSTSSHIEHWSPILFFPERSLDTRWQSLRLTIHEGTQAIRDQVTTYVQGLNACQDGAGMEITNPNRP